MLANALRIPMLFIMLSVTKIIIHNLCTSYSWMFITTFASQWHFTLTRVIKTVLPVTQAICYTFVRFIYASQVLLWLLLYLITYTLPIPFTRIKSHCDHTICTCFVSDTDVSSFSVVEALNNLILDPVESSVIYSNK